jgi:U1 small nuclear ribonucleoprotein of 70kDa MW N terminal
MTISLHIFPLFYYSVIFFFLQQDPNDTPPPTKVETREERLDRRRRERAEQVAYKLEREIAMWDPHQITDTTEDPFKTLFVSRVVSEKIRVFPMEHIITSYFSELRHVRVQTEARI